jgi:type I restriction enzyme, S subunit
MSSWRQVALQDVARIERHVIEPTAIEDGTPYVGLENIQSGGQLIGVRGVHAGELASSKFAFTPDHLLYGKLRPYLAKIARPDFAGICSTDVLPVLPGPRLDRSYLAWFLLTPRMVSLAASRSTGANLPRLSPKSLAEFRIPLPPVLEQRRIAEILDKADALRAKRRAALAQLDTLTECIFLDVGRNTSKPPTLLPLAQVAETSRGAFVNGPFGSDLLTSELQGKGVPVIYIRDIRDGAYQRVSESCVSERKARELAVCTVAAGDVLVAKVGDPPGVAAIYPTGEPPAVVTQDVIRIRIARDVASPEYIVGYLNSSVGQGKVAGITVQATRARFSLRDFKAMTIELPSIELQRGYARMSATVNAVRDAHDASQDNLSELFSALQRRVFRGEI